MFGIILIVLAQRRAAILGLLIAIAAILGSFGTSHYLFRTEGFLLDPLYPAGAAFLIFVTSTLIGFIRTEREKAHVRGAFSRYLSPILVDQLSKNPEKLKLGGELRELTVMFSDIRGFTKLSEGLDPQRLTTVINSFLTPMTRVIQNRQGTIDKYIGDCIMAFWNAPIDVKPHGRMAILAAYDMREELVRINQRFAEEAARTGDKLIEIRIGMGLNSGICCVGNMGSDQRFDYSVLGDTVNTASRLESLSPAYFVDLVIGEETALAVPDFALLELDQVRCCLIHDWPSLTQDQTEAAVKGLERAKASGLVLKIGISGYDEADLNRAIEIFTKVDALQVPVSILDQRLVGARAIEQLKGMGTEIQARSIFLQGLLASQSDSTLGKHPEIENFHDLCEELKISPIQVALSFVQGLEWVDQLVVGITSASELAEIVEASELNQSANRHEITRSIEPSNDLSLIDPRNWNN